MSETTSPHEREARIAQFKKETSDRLSQLLQSGAPIQEIARLFDAEDFVSIEQVGRQAPVHRFDVQAFIKREISAGTFLRLPDSFIKVENIVLPPGDGEVIRSGSGEGVEKKKLIPRSRYLVELLTELNQSYQVVSGTNEKDMMRAESYQIFLIPGMERMVFVNDEEGNATFVIAHATVHSAYAQFSNLTKDELKELGEPLVQIIVYPGDAEEWKLKIKNALEKNINETSVEISSEKKELAIEFAPVGWLTRKALRTKYSINNENIILLVNKALINYPEGKRPYKDAIGHVRDHYSPDIDAYIFEKSAPVGWLNRNVLAKKIKSAAPGTVKSVIDRLVEERPEWEKKKGIRSYYHPDVLIEAEKEFSQRKDAPPGWMTISKIVDAKVILRDNNTIEPIIKAFAALIPDSVKPYKDEGGHIGSHYSPGVIEKTKEYFSVNKKAPEGWKTIKAISAIAKRDEATIKDYAELYRKANKEWFHPYLDSKNHVHEHINPALVEKIVDYFMSLKPAPEGWKTASGLSKKEKVASNDRNIVRFAESMRQQHREWFVFYLNSINVLTEHYHPDLVKLIREKFKK